MNKVLKNHYYNLSLPISRFMSLYANSKSEKEIKTDYNPFTDSEDNDSKILGQFDSICCSCLCEAIGSGYIPRWALDLIDFNIIKSNADKMKRSDKRFYITNGMILLDSFISNGFLYSPMGLFDYEKIERKIENDCLHIYSKDKEYICKVKLNEKLKNTIGIFQFKKEYTSIISNLKLEIVK